MTNHSLQAELFEELCSIPLLDAHTHLVDGKLGARGLHDILLYHMAISDLYAAGCPSGARLTQLYGWEGAGGSEELAAAGRADPGAGR